MNLKAIFKKILFLFEIKYIIIALLFIPLFNLFSQWEICYDSIIKDNGIACLGVNGNKIFAATRGNGMFISLDNGISWKKSISGFDGQWASSFYFQDTRAYVGTNDGFYLSTDDGNTWVSKSSGIYNYNPLPIESIIKRNGIFYIATFGNWVYSSTDEGENWKSNSFGIGEAGVTSLTIKDSLIFASTWGGKGIVTLANNENEWKARNNDVPNTYVRLVTVNNSFMYILPSYFGVYISENNGENWAPLNNGLTNLELFSLAFYENSIFAATFDEGVFLSKNNGDYWYKVNNGLNNLFLTSLAVNDTFAFVGTIQGTYRAKLKDLIATSILSNDERKSRMIIYPNPANNFINISLNDFFKPEDEINIFNIYGDLILKEKIKNNTMNQRINISNLPTGIYYIQIGNLIENFVVMK